MERLFFLTDSNKEYLSGLSPLERIQSFYIEYKNTLKRKDALRSYLIDFHRDLKLYLDSLKEEKIKLEEARDTISELSEVSKLTMLNEIDESISILDKKINDVYDTYLELKNYQHSIEFNYDDNTNEKDG